MKNSSIRFQLNCKLFELLIMTVAFLAILAHPVLAQEGDDDHDGHGHGEEQKDWVRLDQDEMREFGVVVSEAGSAVLEQTLELPGEIRADDNALAHIVPRFSGIVTEVRAQVGDRVVARDILAVIESDESLSPYEMKTLISGTVIDKHITLGEAVSREHAGFIIADLSNVWADITVYQRDLTRVSDGQRVTIDGGDHLPGASGRISYVAPIVNEKTRTALARVVLPNDSGVWRPGTFITAQVVVDRLDVPVAVPRTALQMFQGHDVVFVQTDEGFAPRPVVVGRADRNHLEIVSGLAPGEFYVSQGGFTLKAELGKESFGGGHDH